MEDYEKERDNLLKEAGKRVVFMGATNYPSQVDEAMLDRITLVPIPLPEAAIRAEFFERNFRLLLIEEGYTFDDMAAATDGYSFRDMERLVTYVLEQLRQNIIEDYKVFTPEGELDRNETDRLAAEAVSTGKIVLTRQLFEDARQALPPSSKADSLAELEAFEAKVRAQNGSLK